MLCLSSKSFSTLTQFTMRKSLIDWQVRRKKPTIYLACQQYQQSYAALLFKAYNYMLLWQSWSQWHNYDIQQCETPWPPTLCLISYPASFYGLKKYPFYGYWAKNPHPVLAQTGTLVVNKSPFFRFQGEHIVQWPLLKFKPWKFWSPVCHCSLTLMGT